MKFLREDFFIEINTLSHPVSMYRFHHHNSYEIFYVASGTRSILYDGKIYDLHCGDMVLLCPNLLHKGSGETAYKKIDTEFSKSFLDYYFTEEMQSELLGCFENKVLHLSGSSQKKFEALSLTLADEYKNDKLCAITLAEILRLVNHAASQNKNETGYHAAKSEKVKTVISYIEENFASIKSIDEIAEHAYLNKSYLCRMFKKETNMTLMDFLYNYRIQRACNELISTDCSVLEAGEYCGFENTSHFIKVFKSMLGCTPGQFRRNQKQNL